MSNLFPWYASGGNAIENFFFNLVALFLNCVWLAALIVTAAYTLDFLGIVQVNR